MKKLNRKGFTLVELLAVIIILAIVVGLSIPAITSIINGSKNNALDTKVKAAVKYLGQQYDVYNIDTTTSAPSFQTYMTTKQGKDQELTPTDPLFTAIGFEEKNVSKVKVCVTSTGSVYVEVLAIPTTSEYYTTEHWESDGSAAKTGAKNRVGTACGE